ncbi:osmotically inducible sensory protein [Pacificimonas flava]|uniref:Osmotically inducible sensory protein n=2 Tax=Pacificimonas flava TaxID=1234595 RepID=M2TCF3_9SPHN|nr:osmotically inducible sensory protein [Pacificimonas flava]
MAAAGFGGASGFGPAGDRDRRDEWSDFGTESDEFGGYSRGGAGRSARGGHYGRGPKNDTRSKERLHDRVCEQLHDDDELDAREIEVSTDENGEVTLTGTVNDRWEKRQAEDCAYRVRGARHVQNNLQVQARGEDQQSQTSISPLNE